MSDLVHISGMGVPGSLIAWRLHEAGIDFTWHDIDADATAWEACTGIIYPSGDPDEEACRKEWGRWLDDPPWNDECAAATEASTMFFNHKTGPPHQGECEWSTVDERLEMHVKRAHPPAYHLNAQRFVPATRDAFADRRLDEPPSEALELVTYGFEPNPRNAGYLWGYKAEVSLEFDAGAEAYQTERRPYYYLRYARWVFTYIAPIPGTERFYAGSHLIPQEDLKPLEVEPKFRSWLNQVNEMLGTTVRITEATNIRQGWRPKEDPEDAPWLREDGGTLYLRPLRGNGVRMAPAYTQAVLSALAEQGVPA